MATERTACTRAGIRGRRDVARKCDRSNIPNEPTSSAQFNTTNSQVNNQPSLPKEFHRPSQSITYMLSTLLISSLFVLSRYLANRMPAGHSMPPQPAARSSCSSSGGSSRPSKVNDCVLALRYWGAWTSSSLKPKGSFSGEGERGGGCGGGGHFFLFVLALLIRWDERSEGTTESEWWYFFWLFRVSGYFASKPTFPAPAGLSPTHDVSSSVIFFGGRRWG